MRRKYLQKSCAASRHCSESVCTRLQVRLKEIRRQVIFPCSKIKTPPRSEIADTQAAIAAIEATIVCSAHEWQAAPLVLTCEGTQGSRELDLADGATVTVVEIPAGAVNLTIEIAAAGDLDLRLVDEATDITEECLAGYGCLLDTEDDWEYAADLRKAT